ncbi:MAG TPA: chemotaxis protein CheW [Blastocatellia bacterium]|nr:chemotaxis protein CheW [Blastocatellia bacterium]
MKASGTKSFAPQTLRLVCCVVNNTEFYLEMSAIHNVGRPHQFTLEAASANDNTSLGTIGWLSTQQNRIPVFELAHCLRLSPAPTNLHTGFLILINAMRPFAIHVDQIVGHVDIAPSQMIALPHLVEPGTPKLFKGIVQRDTAWALCADARHLQPLFTTALLSALLPEPPPASATNVVPPPVVDAPAQQGQIMLFSSAQASSPTARETPSLVFGLSLKQVQEVMPLPPMIPIPGAPPYVFGITNWRNVPLPIIDLKTRLGMSTTPVSASAIEPKSRLLIARAPRQNGLLGFPINPQVKTFPMRIPYQPNKHRLWLDSDLLLGIFDLEDSPLLIPDVEAMLTRQFTPQPDWLR